MTNTEITYRIATSAERDAWREGNGAGAGYARHDEALAWLAERHGATDDDLVVVVVGGVAVAVVGDLSGAWSVQL